MLHRPVFRRKVPLILFGQGFGEKVFGENKGKCLWNS